MSGKVIYSICGMCSARCPIQVEVDEDKCRFIQGNRHSPGIKGALCARGAAGLALVRDDERPQFPMIRQGTRGEGQWRRTSWDEALSYVADNLKSIKSRHGGRSILWSGHGGYFADLNRALLRGLGSPNYANNEAVCDINVDHAAMSLFGFGQDGLVLDLKNARHVVLQTRNIFEAIKIREVNDLLDGLEAGGKLTVIDIRATVTAGKADRFMLIRPGTDYALNLAVINTLLDRRLYDAAHAQAYIQNFDTLAGLVKPYTPAWAEAETGIKATEILALAQELAQAAPAVIWHPGMLTARYKDSFYVCRTAYIINALLGSIGAKGGLALAAKPEDLGRRSLNRLTDLALKVDEQRADGVGWKYPQFDGNAGLLHLAFKAMTTGDPYPLKAYVAFDHDPLGAFPDPDAVKRAFNELDLLVSVTTTWSETAWFADVVLPLSSYLERDGLLVQQNGLVPTVLRRERCVEPRFDTKADWEIAAGLAKKLDVTGLAFDSIQDIWKYQLRETGIGIKDFEDLGYVEMAERPVYLRLEDHPFPTPSGRIEIVNDRWTSQGLAALAPYEAKPAPSTGTFRLTIGRCAVHSQGHTMNNAFLQAQMPENVLWINEAVAAKMGITDGDSVVVARNGHSGRIKARLTEFIHPEAVFMVHGFGRKLPVESRIKGPGLADNLFMTGGLDIWDQAGGAVALQEHFVSVTKA